jgi:hypothetical protein
VRVPGGRDKWLHQGSARSVQIGVEEGPYMLATETTALFQQEKWNVWPVLCECKRN